MIRGRGFAMLALCGGVAFLFAFWANHVPTISMEHRTKNEHVDVNDMHKTHARAPGTKHEHVDASDMNKTHARAPGTKHEHVDASDMNKVTGTSRMGLPFPAGLADLENQNVDMSDMEKSQLIVPGTMEKVAVFIYKDLKSDKHVSRSVKGRQTFSKKIVQTIADVWKAGSRGNFFDVGGNIGTFALPIARYILPYRGQVVAIEGMPSIAAHLKAGIVANKLDNIALYQYAVSGPGEGSSVRMMLAPTNKGASSIWDHGQQGRYQEVGLTTIDAILNREPALQKVLVMKMDVEGNEGRALKGARELLAKYPPCYFMFELNCKWLDNAGTPWKSVKQQLDDAGYDTSSVDTSRSEKADHFVVQRDLQQCLVRCSS